ncbi:MAG: hypothetical protein H6838_18760 [Planctomycetes bacterium]|nr:hypothetical protein [Planctomycetota bacterium]
MTKGALLPLLLGVVFGIGMLARSTFVQTEHVAVYHDELWNLPAAVGLLEQDRLVPEQEVRVFGLRLPLVTGPYQGAIKSYLAAPVLALFGGAPWVLRGGNLGLAIVYLLSLFWALRAATGPRVAAAVFLLPLLDPNFLLFVPTDQGPFLLQNTLLAVAIGAVLRAYASRQRGHLLLAMVAASAALADKLTGAPCVAALMVTAAWWLWPALRHELGSRRGAALAALTALPLLPTAIYFARNGLGPLRQMTGIESAATAPYLQRWWENARELVRQVGDPYMARALTETRFDGGGLSWFVVVGLLVWGAALVLAAWPGRREPARERGLFLPLLLLVTFCAFTAVPGLQRPWHFLMLQPVLVLAVFASADRLLRRFAALRLLRPIAALVLVAVAGQGAWIGLRATQHLAGNRGVNLGSTSLYDVLEFLHGRGCSRVVGLSYSIANPLYVLSMGRIEPIDAAFGDFSAAATPALLQQLQVSGTCLVHRRCCATAQTKGEHLAWLNAGSDWAQAQLALGDPGLKHWEVTDPRGTSFGVLWRE